MSERNTYRGIPLEHEGFDNNYFRITVPAIQRFEKLHRNTEVELLGEFPKEGPVLVVANHTTSWESGIILPYAVLEVANRPTRMVVRDTLLDTSKTDSEHVLERTGKNGLAGRKFSTKILKQAGRPLGHIIQKGGNAIPVRRGDAREKFFNDVEEAFSDQNVVGMFFQETRTPEDDLSNVLPGAAMIMRRNPDVPVCLMALSNVGSLTTGEGRAMSPKVTIAAPITLVDDIDPDLVMKAKHINENLIERMAALLESQGVQDIKRK